jgi:hypothetical protein
MQSTSVQELAELSAETRILRYHASGCLNHTSSSIDRRGRRGSSLLDGTTFLTVTPHSTLTNSVKCARTLVEAIRFCPTSTPSTMRPMITSTMLISLSWSREHHWVRITLWILTR